MGIRSAGGATFQPDTRVLIVETSVATRWDWLITSID